MGIRNNISHTSWRGMKERCSNKNYKQFMDYGGRGIKVCDRWMQSFENFVADMGERPSREYSIERIDNDLDYNKDNCKWALRSEQNANKRRYRNNKYGIAGVYWNKSSGLWTSEYHGKYLGCSKSFFEACCLRKSAEVSP